MFPTILYYSLLPITVIGGFGLIVLSIFLLATRKERTPISHSDADTLRSDLPSSRESAVSTNATLAGAIQKHRQRPPAP